MRTIEYSVVITGSLPIDPYLIYHKDIKHLCTTTVVYYTENKKIIPGKVVICDPGWTNEEEEKLFILALARLDLTPDNIEYIFLSHHHYDHYCGYLRSDLISHVSYLSEKNIFLLKGLRIISLPGHSRDSQALCFTSRDKEVAVAGDTVINEQYLLCREVYRPNGYTEDEIKKTRESMNYLVNNYNIIIPGHGPPIEVTRQHRWE